MNAVSFVGYVVAFLIVIIVAARWIYRNHPALRDTEPSPPDPRQPGAKRPDSDATRD